MKQLFRYKQKVKANFKYLENQNSFKGEIKSIFYHFKELASKQVKQFFLEGEGPTLRTPLGSCFWLFCRVNIFWKEGVFDRPSEPVVELIDGKKKTLLLNMKRQSKIENFQEVNVQLFITWQSDRHVPTKILKILFFKNRYWMYLLDLIKSSK